MWPFSKGKKNEADNEHKKCYSCGKSVSTSECTKSADGKCLCKNCHDKNHNHNY